MKSYELGTCEAARILGKSPRCVGRLINSGQLPAIKSGRTFRISESDLADYVERSRVVPTSECSTQLMSEIQNFEHEQAEHICEDFGT
jgi:excisionase family DNA binding protein